MNEGILGPGPLLFSFGMANRLQAGFAKRFVHSQGIRSTQTLSPAVYWRVKAHRIDPQAVSATGPKNNILKGDILRYLQDQSQSPSHNKQNSLPGNYRKYALILTKSNMKAIKEFTRSDVVEECYIWNALLLKALCHSLIGSQGIPPDSWMAIHALDGSIKYNHIGSSLSTKCESNDPPEVFLGINLSCARSIPSAPLIATIHCKLDTVVIELESHSNGTLLDMESLIQHFHRNILDPPLMLL